MRKLTIRFGYVILCLLIVVPVHVFALENPINSTILMENYEKNVHVAQIQNGIETSPQARLNDNEQDFITDSRNGQKFVKDRVIVRFKSPKNGELSISHEKIRKAHAIMGAKIEKDLSVGSVSGLQVVQLPNGTDVRSAIIAYESNPDVLYAEPDYVISIIPDQTGSVINEVNFATILSIPNDGDFSKQWGLHNTGQAGGTPNADINAPAAWNISTGSNSVVVAVIDTGVLYTHSDLSSNIWNNTDELPGNGIDDDHNGYIDDVRGWNFVNSSNNPIDDQEHGTHVSGTIGAVGNNAIGVAGVNWRVKIMPLKAFDQYGYGSTSDAIDAINYANANGASVISNSWGGSTPSDALKEAIDASPAVVVCAAGNSASNNDASPIYPASYNSTNIISVAATDQNDTLADFSNFGLSSVDLAAPGTNIWSTNLDGNYAWKSGTSMATPHVSGVAALVKAVNPSLTSAQIKNIILSTVDIKSSLSGKVASGGRLNAYKAVVAANPPVADFIGTPRNGTAPLTVVFTDLSTDSPTSWNWTFGDGSIVNATVRDPVHTYLSRGNFTVSLNVTNLGGFHSTIKVGYINLTNGTTTVGVFRNGLWYLRNSNSNGIADLAFTHGQSGDVPVVGDWDGNGIDTIGVFRNGVFYLRNNNTNGIPDLSFAYGQSGDVPVIGDWDGNGIDTIGVFRNGVFYLRNNNTNGVPDLSFAYGQSGDVPVIGDWDGNGIDTIGVFRNGMDYLRNNNTNGIPDLSFAYGQSGDVPVAGNWDGI